MSLTDIHSTVLSKTFEKVLGAADQGSMAYVRSLTSDVVHALAESAKFAPQGWVVCAVADRVDPGSRTISADRAVEMRESKGDPVLLLVDTARAGAGMDGIYSAAREVQESELFEEAIRLAAHKVTTMLSRSCREFAEQAVKKARGRGRRLSLSPWAEFDFLATTAAERRHPGSFLHLLGLWPIQENENLDGKASLDISTFFVNRLLGTGTANSPPSARIESLRLLDPTQEQREALESFLRLADTRPLLSALAGLSDQPSLWVNALQIEATAQGILGIELIPWQNRNGKLAKWSGLIEGQDENAPPVFFLRPDTGATGDYSKLEIRWKARPENLAKGAVEYRVAIMTDMEEELAGREVSHSAKTFEKCRFTNDDFSTLSENALVSAKVVVSVIGNETAEPQQTEEFLIRIGEAPEHEKGGGGKKVRAFSEGLIELEDRDMVTDSASYSGSLPQDAKGFVLFRTTQRGKSFRVFRPPLIREAEEKWAEAAGAIGRWRVKVRSSGARAGALEFVPFHPPVSSKGTLWEQLLDRAENASRRMAERFSVSGGGVGQIYDERAKSFDLVKEYLLAWAALLEQVQEGDPCIALVNTVEVQSLSGRTIGLIVLPSHPLRVAWHLAYDSLVFHARFEQQLAPKDVREELKGLDGAMFPAFLPGLDGESTFVFSDTLGFHAVGMVLDRDKEPKAAMALLARALGESETADSSPTVGGQSAEILGREIIKYLECHDAAPLLHIHALRPGDGMTVARSLGQVLKHYQDKQGEDEMGEERGESNLAFVLEIYPSKEQRGIAGRFIAEAREKRRTGAGVLSSDDLWMLQSISREGGVSIARLRWARRDVQNPETAAHLAAAFDTFESRVVTLPRVEKTTRRPIFAFGLLSFYERLYSSQPSPVWMSLIPSLMEGEKHPADRTHTERLLRIQQALLRAVVRTLGGTDGDQPVLRTEIPPEKAENIRALHALCDWVITVDRNAGIEYFDSPNDNREIYDAYVIDCVPEREDLGCLQLITSTSNLDEVRNLLDHALDQMGLSRSLRNAEFLMEHLKALSGRLALRLTGQKGVTGELIALALVEASCRKAPPDEDRWTPLAAGFFVPIDDILDLLPPLAKGQDEGADREVRGDLIHVSLSSRSGLVFRFVEVKYRRHLRSAREPAGLELLRGQTEGLRKRWEAWYCNGLLTAAARAVRRAKLARVLRFYADKGMRHYLDEDTHRSFVSEIDRMVTAGGSYSFGTEQRGDRGFIFCPEFAGMEPLEVTPGDWDTRVFLFGPGRLPDSDFRGRSSGSGDVRPLADSIESSGEETSKTLGEQIVPDPYQRESRNSVVAAGSTNSAIPPSMAEDHSCLSVQLGIDPHTNEPVLWLPTSRGNPHLLMVGLSGTGKTTCLVSICTQLWRQGALPIVFSYHQDIDERLRQLLGEIRFVDYSGLGFNPLLKPARESKRTYLDVAGEMRDIFTAIYPELGDIQGEAIRQAIKESYLEKGWSHRSNEQEGLEEPMFGRFLEILRQRPKPDRGHRTLLARLEELADYGFFESTVDRGSLWESKEPIVIRIHTTQNENLQRAFAALLFYGFYKEMFYRRPQERIDHFIVFDEAHRASRLKLIPTMAQECRKFGIGLILASQKAGDFHLSLFSLIANYLILRLTDSDARALVRNVTSSDQERSLVDKIKQMERHRGLFFCEGKRKPALVKFDPPES